MNKSEHDICIYNKKTDEILSREQMFTYVYLYVHIDYSICVRMYRYSIGISI